MLSHARYRRVKGSSPHALTDNGEMLLDFQCPSRTKTRFFGKALEGGDTFRDFAQNGSNLTRLEIEFLSHPHEIASADVFRLPVDRHPMPSTVFGFGEHKVVGGRESKTAVLRHRKGNILCMVIVIMRQHIEDGTAVSQPDYAMTTKNLLT